MNQNFECHEKLVALLKTFYSYYCGKFVRCTVWWLDRELFSRRVTMHQYSLVGCNSQEQLIHSNFVFSLFRFHRVQNQKQNYLWY